MYKVYLWPWLSRESPLGAGRVPLGMQRQAQSCRPIRASLGLKKIKIPGLTELIHCQLIKKPQERRIFFEWFCLERIHLNSTGCRRAFWSKGSEFQGAGYLLFASLRSHFHKHMSLMLKMFSSTGIIFVAVTWCEKMFYSLFTHVKKIGSSFIFAVINFSMPSVWCWGVHLTFSTFWGHISEMIGGTGTTCDQR